MPVNVEHAPLPAPATPATLAPTRFRYVGTSYMLFYGPSGKKYRFSGHGAERDVDPRDRDFVRNIPNLREVKPKLQ